MSLRSSGAPMPVAPYPTQAGILVVPVAARRSRVLEEWNPGACVPRLARWRGLHHRVRGRVNPEGIPWFPAQGLARQRLPWEREARDPTNPNGVACPSYKRWSPNSTTPRAEQLYPLGIPPGINPSLPDNGDRSGMLALSSRDGVVSQSSGCHTLAPKA